MAATTTTTTKRTVKRTTAKKSPIEILAAEKAKRPEGEEREIEAVPKRKILFAASEATPFIATGGLAEVVGSLSKALAKDPSYDVRVVLPLYSDIRPEHRRKLSFLGNIFVPLSWRNQYCGIFSCEQDGVTFYFLDNEYYFKRPGCYGYYDDGERFAFFSRSVMEILPFIKFYPDVLHCHDWQGGAGGAVSENHLLPPSGISVYPFAFHHSQHRISGKYSLDILEDLFGISNQYRYLLEYQGCINLMKGAIECSERFSTVSPTYAEEIKSPQYAHGLQDIVRRNAFKLSGILNGIDTVSYDPATDRALFANYDAEHLENKGICKSELQKMLGLPRAERARHRHDFPSRRA